MTKDAHCTMFCIFDFSNYRDQMKVYGFPHLRRNSRIIKRKKKCLLKVTNYFDYD